MTRLARRPRVSPRARTWLGVGLALGLGFGLGTLRPLIDRPPLVIGQDAAVPGGPSAGVRTTLEDVGGPVLHIQPASGAARVLLVLYPGGLVRPQAYEWLGRALAARGVETVIPAFPLDLAVLQANRADALIARYGAGKRVVVAGHSLGGAMAAQYAARHPGEVAGLVLMAAYPANNISLADQARPTLSLLAERDGVADPAAVRGGLERLPKETTLTVLPGAVHAFFGRYGPQRGDGTPTVTRDQAEQDILAAVTAFLDRIETR